MPQEKNSSAVDFLNNIDVPFKEDDVTPVAEEKDDKPLPFNKDPKIQRYIRDEVAKRFEAVKPSAEQQFVREVRDEINLPSSFIKLVGNDTEEKKQVLKDLSDYFGTLKGEAKREAWDEMQSRIEEANEEQRQQDVAAIQELEQGFEEIESTFNVDLTSNTPQAQKLDTDFRAYIRKVAHKNADGEVDSFPDLVSTFEEFASKKPAPASRAKELASRGLTRSAATTSATPPGKSWRDVDKYFSQLKANN